jgi:hypothetical protein
VDVTETSVTAPSHVAALAASVSADAVLLDVVEPPALRGLLDRLTSYTVLRPLLEYVPTRRGERQPRFVGYGRVTSAGTVERLAHGELSPSP